MTDTISHEKDENKTSVQYYYIHTKIAEMKNKKNLKC